MGSRAERKARRQEREHVMRTIAARAIEKVLNGGEVREANRWAWQELKRQGFDIKDLGVQRQFELAMIQTGDLFEERIRSTDSR